MNQLVRFTPVVAKPEAFIDSKSGQMITAIDLGYLNWDDANTAVEELNARSFLGFNDWCLPSVDQWNPFIDRSRYNPAADPVLGLKQEAYWTSTPVASLPDYAWCVFFYDGGVNRYGRNGKCRVRAVRAASQ